jgi:hypothetical protein
MNEQFYLLLSQTAETNLPVTSIHAEIEEDAIESDQFAQVLVRDKLCDVQPYVSRDVHEIRVGSFKFRGEWT